MPKPVRSVPALMDVARKAGVGAATVSRVINGGVNVSAATLERVQRAIRDLGYHPSQAARSLKGARTRTIGLIVPSVADSFFSIAAAAIQQVARRHDTLVLLAESGNQPSREREVVTSFIQRRIDGLILVPTVNADEDLLKHAGFAVVCFDRPLHGNTAPTVLSDNTSGARMATEHLVSLGRTRILCLGDDPRLFTSRKRVQGYRTVMQRAKLPCLIETQVQDFASAKLALDRHLAGRERIDAIFSTKNSVTVYAYQLLRAAGLKIPEEVALVGFDDFGLADLLDPPITVVRQPVEQIATRAAELLFEALDTTSRRSAAAVRQTVLPVELVARASCGEHLRNPRARRARKL